MYLTYPLLVAQMFEPGVVLTAYLVLSYLH